MDVKVKVRRKYNLLKECKYLKLCGIFLRFIILNKMFGKCGNRLIILEVFNLDVYLKWKVYIYVVYKLNRWLFYIL